MGPGKSPTAAGVPSPSRALFDRARAHTPGAAFPTADALGPRLACRLGYEESRCPFHKFPASPGHCLGDASRYAAMLETGGELVKQTSSPGRGVQERSTVVSRTQHERIRMTSP